MYTDVLSLQLNSEMALHRLTAGYIKVRASHLIKVQN